MTQLEFDEKLAEQMEVVYRSRDVLRRRRLVYEALGAKPGERVYLKTVDGFGPSEADAWAAEQRELAERGEFYFACTQLRFGAVSRGGA